MLKEFRLTLKVIAMGSTHAKQFPRKKYKEQQQKLDSSMQHPPHTESCSVFFFFLEKTCWLPAESVITRHNSGSLGEILIITADIYKMLLVYLELD